jgi:hypothetical protein
VDRISSTAPVSCPASAIRRREAATGLPGELPVVLHFSLMCLHHEKKAIQKKRRDPLTRRWKGGMLLCSSVTALQQQCNTSAQKPSSLEKKEHNKTTIQ